MTSGPEFIRYGLVAAVAVSSAVAGASPGAAQEEDLPFSVNDFGGVGLLQTRTARFARDGQFEIGASFVNPYRRYYLNWQILPWLEANFRYTDVTNKPVGMPPFDQTQGQFFKDLIRFKSGNYLDRGFDLKFRLWGEDGARPALAVGLQDMLGTGLFSGEYFVASKHFGRFDLSLGLGWGYLGNRGPLPNPFKIFGSRFDQRDANVGEGGKVDFGNFFAGDRIGLFGGVEYFSPIEGLSLKLEYNGSDPAREPLDNVLKETIPLGIGLNYRPSSWFDFSLGLERGNTVMLRTAFRMNFFSKGVPKQDPPQPALLPRPDPRAASLETILDQRPARPAQADLRSLYDEFYALAFDVKAIDFDGISASVRLSRIGDAPATAGDELTVAERVFEALPQTIQQLELQLFDGSRSHSMIFTRNGIKLLATIDKGFAYLPDQGGFVTAIEMRSRRLIVEANANWSAHQKVLNQAATALALGTAGADKVTLTVNGRVLFELDGYALRAERQTQALVEPIEESGGNLTGIKLDGETLVIEARGADSTTKVTADRVRSELINDTRELSDLSTIFLSDPDAGATVQNRDIATSIFNELESYGFTGRSLEMSDLSATIYLSKTPYMSMPRNIGWASKVVANHVPASVEEITVVQMTGNAEASRVTVLRSDLERADRNQGGPAETWAHVRLGANRPKGDMQFETFENPDAHPNFSWSLAPQLNQHIGDPRSGIYLADVNARLAAAFSPAPGWRFSAQVTRFLFGNLDTIERESDSTLPHVRSDIVRYLQEGRTALSRFQVDYVTNIAPDVFVRGSAGLFEPMFGGVGGEILYRPVGESWAIGADLNWVKQRGFNQLFDFRNYDVVTGHVSLYNELPRYNLRSVISAGRYLAGDYGVTIDLSREFPSGVRVGGFATFTDVSAAEFGEGSFDKGFYISFPLDLLLSRSAKQRNSLLFRPLTRDGGQQLAIGPRLFDITEEGRERRLRQDWYRLYE